MDHYKQMITNLFCFTVWVVLAFSYWIFDNPIAGIQFSIISGMFLINYWGHNIMDTIKEYYEEETEE